MSSFCISLIYLLFLLIFFCCNLLHQTAPQYSNSLAAAGYGDGYFNNSSSLLQPTSSHRKLLFHAGESCTKRDISISQSRDLSSGIPQYIVQIVNTCVSGCAPSNIHLHCGWFASARIVTPKTFKRLSYDDCLVNGGMSLKTSQVDDMSTHLFRVIWDAITDPAYSVHHTQHSTSSSIKHSQHSQGKLLLQDQQTTAASTAATNNCSVFDVFGKSYDKKEMSIHFTVL